VTIVLDPSCQKNNNIKAHVNLKGVKDPTQDKSAKWEHTELHKNYNCVIHLQARLLQYLPNADEHAAEVRVTRTPKAPFTSVLSLLVHQCLEHSSRWLTVRFLKQTNHQIYHREFQTYERLGCHLIYVNRTSLHMFLLIRLPLTGPETANWASSQLFIFRFQYKPHDVFVRSTFINFLTNTCNILH